MKRLDPALINSPLCRHSYYVEQGDQPRQVPGSQRKGEDRVQRPMTLLQRCQAGDEQAWQEVFSSYATRIYRWAALLGLSGQEAEDAAQEVFATAVRKIHTCKGPELPSSWMFQITRRIVANMRRLAWWKVMLRAADADEQLEPALTYQSPQGRELELEVRHCLRRLPLRHTEILVLMDIEGFTREEAAQALNVPPGTVASRLRKARAVLRATLEAREPCSCAEDRSSPGGLKPAQHARKGG